MLQGEALKKRRLDLYEESKGTPVEFAYETDLEFTCDNCRDNETCEYAFDGYNTNGDCLASK